MDPLTIAGLGVGLIGGIGSMFGAGRANRKLEEMMRRNPAYQANPLAQQRLGLAQTLLNARMPGAASAERNIYQNQANQMAAINRGATDSSQVLAMAAAGQGQANQAFGNLAQQEAQDYQRRYGNLTNAQDFAVQEKDKEFQDQVRRYQDMVAIQGAKNQNTQGIWNNLTQLGLGAANLGMAGGMGNLFGTSKGPSGYYYGTDSNLMPSTYKVPLAKY